MIILLSLICISMIVLITIILSIIKDLDKEIEYLKSERRKRGL